MSVSWMIYLAEVSDKLCFMFGLFSFISAIALILTGLWYFHLYGDGDNEEREARLRLKISLMLFLSFCFLAVLFPNSKTIYLMAGTKYLSESSLPEKVKNALEKKLDEIIEGEKK
jgi:uncharacterized sodium:solute symporter family permease YidK